MAGDVVFVVNPASANGSTRRRWPEIAHLAAEAGLVGPALLSEAPGQIADLARRACEDGARLVVAVGGDGTVNEAVNGLMRVEPERRAELGTVPRGTGKDFARSFGIPTSVERALGVARDGAVRTVDVGRASFVEWDGTPGEAYFANFAGAGISGAVAARANTSSKALGGKIAFLRATTSVFMRWKNSVYEVRIDGERRSGRMLEVIAAIGDQLAGGMRLAPEADPEDGLFDVVLIGDATKVDFVRTLPGIYRGTYLPHPRAEVVRGRRLEIET
ncbi:MAG: diacylglycerol/lipid kinase family protein, partial [Gaiellaceae bacterium]